MMNSPICKMLGIEFPLLAFSHCRDVVAAVSKAGGMGVFGAVNLPPDRLKEELDWIDKHCGGKPYGVDLIVPNKMEGKAEPFNPNALLGAIPQEHKDFASGILKSTASTPATSKPTAPTASTSRATCARTAPPAASRSRSSIPIKLIANALGVPPQVMLEVGSKHGVPGRRARRREGARGGAGAGRRRHPRRRGRRSGRPLRRRVDHGAGAGSHRAVRAMGADTPILAAGGIITGAQMAAAMAMGAAGAWCGSVWLTTTEAETNPIVKEKMLAASSRDTVRSRSRTGKPSRQLRSPWTDAWEREDAPEPLPMPLQTLVSEPALRRVDKLAQGGHDGAQQLATYWVGQGVGLMNQSDVGRTGGAAVQGRFPRRL